MKLRTAKIIGLNSDLRAALAVCEVQNDQNAFLAILQLSCDDAFTRGRQVLSELSDFYFEFEGSGSEKINATFEEVSKKFAPDVSFDLLLASLSGKILYLIGQGEVDLYLKREGKLSSLLQVGSQKHMISGFLEDEDKLLFSTKNLINFLKQDLSRVLDLEIENFEEEISTRLALGEFEDQGVAGLLVNIEKEPQQEAVEPPSLLKNQQQSAALKGKMPKLNLSFLAKIPNILKGLLPAKAASDQYLDYQPKKFFLLRLIPSGIKGKFILALLLGVVVVVFSLFQYRNNKEKQKMQQFNQVLSSAKADFETAKANKDSNQIDAKNKLTSAKDNVQKALVLYPKNVDATRLKEEIEQNEGSILQQFSAVQLPLYLDLDLVKKNFRATNMSLSDGKMLLLDPAAGTLVVIDLAKKNQSIIAGSEQIGESSFASLNDKFAFTFAKDKGVIRVDITNQKVVSVAKKDAGWGDIKDIAGFGSNVYLLDTGSGQIWKYVAAGNSYSDKKEYLNSGVKVDLTDSIRMQIDSSIYIMKSTGEVIRFTKGNKDVFSYSGLPNGVKSPKSFFTSSDTDNFYVLDSGNSRLLVLSKSGVFKSEYKADKLATASDLIVDEVGKKVYLLDSGKIYSMDLK